MKSILDMDEQSRKIYIRELATERVKNKIKRKYEKGLALC